MEAIFVVRAIAPQYHIISNIFNSVTLSSKPWPNKASSGRKEPPVAISGDRYFRFPGNIEIVWTNSFSLLAFDWAVALRIYSLQYGERK